MTNVIYSFTIAETNKDLVQILLKPGDVYVFGRGKIINGEQQCDYIINRPIISRVHAKLIAKENEVIIILDGDGEKPSKNGIYDSEGDPISVHKNVNPGEFVYICLEPDYKVVLTYVQTILDDTDEVDILTDSERIDKLNASMDEIRNLLKTQMATTKASSREIREKETQIMVKENDLRSDVESLKSDLRSLKENDFESLKTDVGNIKKVNDTQNKALSFLIGLFCLGLVIFGTTGSFKELSREEKKDVYDLFQNVIVAVIGVIGGGKLLSMSKDDKPDR